MGTSNAKIIRRRNRNKCIETLTKLDKVLKGIQNRDDFSDCKYTIPDISDILNTCVSIKVKNFENHIFGKLNAFTYHYHILKEQVNEEGDNWYYKTLEYRISRLNDEITRFNDWSYENLTMIKRTNSLDSLLND